MKLENKKPSPTELVILKSLWQQSPMSAKEVHDKVSTKLNWSYSSTRKTLDRMRDKKYLRVENAHGIKVFFPIVEKIEILANFVSDLSRRILEVDSPLPISLFSDSKLLDENELDKLEAYINSEFKDHE
ncbi:MAG: BlaI/MecI/CopY family transcriptional regulator [Marinicellaceae bacterium]